MTRKSMSLKSPATTPPVSARTRRKSTAVGKTATPSTPVALANKRKSLAVVSAATPAKGTPNKRKSVVPVTEEQVESPKKLRNSLGSTPGGRKSLKKETTPVSKKIEEEMPSDAEDSIDSDEEGQKENVKEESEGQDEEQEDSDDDTELLPSKTSPSAERKKEASASEETNGKTPSDGDNTGEDEASSGDEGKASKPKPQNGNVKKSANTSEDLSKRERTIFVGNLPKEINHKEVSKLFSKYGKISSVRLRSAPVADSRVPKKVAVIKKDFHADRTNINAYVVFDEVTSVKESLVANGMKVFDRHIRVSMLKAPQMDNNKAVFIGNLNFGADEEEIRKVFEDCGPIVSVRIVRDQVRGIGRGFAYVNFETTGAVELALLKDGAQVGKRPIRVHRCKEILKKKRSRKTKRPLTGSPMDGAKTSEIQENQNKGRKTKIAGQKFTAKKKNQKEKSPEPKPGKQHGETSFAGQKVGEKGKINKKGSAKKMTPKKKQAIETLAKTMPGSTEKKSPQKGFTRYFNQQVK